MQVLGWNAQVKVNVQPTEVLFQAGVSDCLPLPFVSRRPWSQIDEVELVPGLLKLSKPDISNPEIKALMDKKLADDNKGAQWPLSTSLRSRAAGVLSCPNVGVPPGERRTATPALTGPQVFIHAQWHSSLSLVIRMAAQVTLFGITQAAFLSFDSDELVVHLEGVSKQRKTCRL